MAAEKRQLFRAFRISRKLALLSGGFLLVLGVSGTAALVFAPAHLIPGYSDEPGGSCKTIYQSEFRRGREKRLVAVISTDDTQPEARVKTGMRIARHLAETAHPDLVIVQIMDRNGPTDRSQLRGVVIGTEIMHAPNPSKTLAASKPWEARYVDGLPTKAGFYFGPKLDMRLMELEAINHKIELVEGCDGDMIEGEAASHTKSETKGKGDKPAKSSGH